jgi:hypothetical protein
MEDKLDQYRLKLEKEVVLAKQNLKQVFLPSSNSSKNNLTDNRAYDDENAFNTYLKGMENISHFLIDKEIGGDSLKSVFNFLEQFSKTYREVDVKIKETSLVSE